MPKISVVTPSFNKKEYIRDAIESVLNQSFVDFEYWILENSTDEDTENYVFDLISKKDDDRVIYVTEYFSDKERRERYPTAVLLNKYYEKMRGEYYFYLSDDDYILPDCFKKMVEFLDNNPALGVCYHSQKAIVKRGGGWEDLSLRQAEIQIPRGGRPDCQIDGGSIMFRKKCLQGISKPYYPETYPEASHCDGLFMNKLAEHWDFYPIRETLSVHRKTEKSTWDRAM